MSTASSYIILAGLIGLVTLAPIAVGSVHIISYSLMEALVFGLLLLHLWTFDFSTLHRKNVRDQNVNPESHRVKSEDRRAPVEDLRISLDELPPVVWSPGSSARSHRDKILSGAYLRKTGLLALPMLVFLAIVLFQLIPLPFDVLRILSPGTASLYGKLGISDGCHPLTLSVYSTTAALLKWSAYMGVFAIITTWSPIEGRLRGGRWIIALLIAIFAVAFLEAIYGLYAAFNRLDSLLWFKRLFNIGIVAGTWVNPDHFAGFTNMAILSSLGLFTFGRSVKEGRRRNQRSRTRWFVSSEQAFWLWVLFVGLLSMVLASIFSLSRMGHVSLLAGIGFMVLIYSARKLNLMALIMVIVVGLAVVWGIWKGIEPVMMKWGKVENALYSNRLVVWKGVFSFSRTVPVFGTGLGTFELVYPAHKDPEFASMLYDHAHNDYLEILSETGCVGLVAWLTFFVAFLCSAIKKWFERRDVIVRTIGAGGIAAVIAILIHSMADFNLQIPSNTLLLLTIMALTWRTLNTSFAGKEMAGR